MTPATDAPPSAIVPLRAALGSLVPPGLLLAFIYSLAGTWSIGQGFGGESDTGWVDFQGRPIDHPPPVVDVHGQPAAWVFIVVAVILSATAVRMSRTTEAIARRRAVIGIVVAAVFVVAVILAFTVLQMQLVQTAFEHGSTHPTLLGNVTVTEHPMERTG